MDEPPCDAWNEGIDGFNPEVVANIAITDWLEERRKYLGSGEEWPSWVQREVEELCEGSWFKMVEAMTAPNDCAEILEQVKDLLLGEGQG